LKIHEYQAKELMKQHGIAVPIGRVATTVEEAVAAVRPIVEASGNAVVVVKSQIHAGGRGKGRFVEHPDVPGVNVVTDGLKGGVEATERRVRELAEKMLGSTLVTVQTGPEGKQVNRLYVEQGIDIERELYLSVVLDRATGRNVVMASTEGGMEIEEVAAETPEKILRETIDPAVGLLDFQARRLAFGLGLAGAAHKNGARFVKALAGLAVGLDTDMVEINPLVVTKSGDVMARAALYEAAHILLTRVKRWSSLKAWGMRLVKNRGHKRAVTALARRMSVLMHRIWIEGTVFIWKTGDGQVAAPAAVAGA